MNPSRILPDLQCSLLCEEVRQEISGNPILIGVLGYLRLPQFPVTALRLFVFNRWVAGVGTFQETVRLIAPDESVVRQGQSRFSLQEASHHATNVTILQQVEFKTPGVYYVEVLVDELLKIRFPFPVMHVPQNPQGQRPGAPKGPEAPGHPAEG